ncbi:MULTISPECIES: LCP family protein [unclassified Nocardioides]|uniref:LCP family protein n=1 Tax=unclassified Nocardioides TaxID=2615069 RepID=UPI0024050DDD|nr:MULTISPECIES: LCP family protein [unclassified Nocardioides]
MTLVLPGSAQLVAGDRRVGRFALRVWLGLVGVVALVALVSLVWDGFAFSLALNTDVLGVLRLLLIALALGWAALFVDAWRLGEPMTLQRNRRLVAVGVNGVLCFSVVGSLLFGAHIVGAGQGAIQTVFGEGEATEATGGRYNVLLLGADAGDGRVGLRTDSMTLASIDEQSGETVLVSLPRNLANFPFAPGSVMDEQFPDGFDCEGCYLNGVTTWATDHPDLFGASSSASEDELFEIGMDATLSAVEGVTDLDVNYWAMVDMGGFERLVDAVGGVEMNVRSRIPIGGVGSPVYGYIEPGVQQLDGYQALWFSRSREDSDDYSRMARQKCVMSAMLQQLDPATLVSRFGEIAAAGSAMLETSIPRSELDTFVDLALKARSEPIATVSIVPPAVDTANPDMAVVHRMIDDAVGRSSATADSAAEAAAEAEASAAATEAATESDAEAEVEGEPTVTGGSLGSRDDGYTANETTDLGSSC